MVTCRQMGGSVWAVNWERNDSGLLQWFIIVPVFEWRSLGQPLTSLQPTCGPTTEFGTYRTGTRNDITLQS